MTRNKRDIKAIISTTIFMAVFGILVGYAYVHYKKTQGEKKVEIMMGTALMFAFLGAILGGTKNASNKPNPESLT